MSSPALTTMSARQAGLWMMATLQCCCLMGRLAVQAQWLLQQQLVVSPHRLPTRAVRTFHLSALPGGCLCLLSLSRLTLRLPAAAPIRHSR